MEDQKWYEKLKNQCPKCNEYDAIRFLTEDSEFYNFGCKFCDFKKRRFIIRGTLDKDSKIISYKDGSIGLNKNGRIVDNSLF